MAYFPMFVSLKHRPCLIAGGGRVAVRKCRGLLSFGADVTMIAREFRADAAEGTAAVDVFCEADGTALSAGPYRGKEFAGGRLERIQRSFREEDLAARDWAVVIAATDDRLVNSRIAACCREKRIPVNVADCQEECSFFFPAYCVAGEITAGISTAGTSPRTASWIRRKLEAVLPLWIAGAGKEGESGE